MLDGPHSELCKLAMPAVLRGLVSADKQDCDCDEGCYFCMVTLRLKVSAVNREYGQPMAVTSDMLEIVPSPNTVSLPGGESMMGSAGWGFAVLRTL